MKELVVLSGKGGTGKTSVVSSFAALSKNAVFADCDVDAADLHIILEPEVQEEGAFSGGKLASVRPRDCVACGVCADVCAFGAVSRSGPPAEEAAFRHPGGDRGGAPGDATFVVDPVACEGCGVCAHFCPVGAIDFEQVENGRWYLSQTRFGPMAHAKLGIAEENSGKLSALVRENAARLARESERELIITDGPPGVGCPVISSVTGADLILVVAEPTQSGLHDLERVLGLARHFGIPALVAINKADLNTELAGEIERTAGEDRVLARIPYDRTVTDAQIEKLSVVEYARRAQHEAPGPARDGQPPADPARRLREKAPSPPAPSVGPPASAAAAIRDLWETVSRRLSAL